MNSARQTMLELPWTAQVAIATSPTFLMPELTPAIEGQLRFFGLIDEAGKLNLAGQEVLREMARNDAEYMKRDILYGEWFSSYYERAYRPAAKAHKEFHTALFLRECLAALLLDAVEVCGRAKNTKALVTEPVARVQDAYSLIEKGLLDHGTDRRGRLLVSPTKFGSDVAAVLLRAERKCHEIMGDATPSAWWAIEQESMTQALRLAAALAAKAVQA